MKHKNPVRPQNYLMMHYTDCHRVKHLHVYSKDHQRQEKFPTPHLVFIAVRNVSCKKCSRLVFVAWKCSLSKKLGEKLRNQVETG